MPVEYARIGHNLEAAIIWEDGISYIVTRSRLDQPTTPSQGGKLDIVGKSLGGWTPIPGAGSLKANVMFGVPSGTLWPIATHLAEEMAPA